MTGCSFARVCVWMEQPTHTHTTNTFVQFVCHSFSVFFFSCYLHLCAAHCHDTNGNGVLFALGVNDDTVTLLQSGFFFIGWHFASGVGQSGAHDVGPSQQKGNGPLVHRHTGQFEGGVLVHHFERRQNGTVPVLKKHRFVRTTDPILGRFDVTAIQH